MRKLSGSEAVVAALASAGAVVLVTAVIAAVKPHVPVLSLGVLYVFAVLPVAVVWGIGFGIAVSIASMLAFNWFYLPPTHTFALRDGANWFALAVYLVTAIVVSGLAARARRRAADAERREREAALLAEISQALLSGREIRDELGWIGERCAEVLGVAIATIELGPGDGYELRADGRLVGTLSIPSGEALDLSVRDRFLQSLASLLAVALDRARLASSDAVKTAVLRAVSHDLRSPLTAISAAVSGLEESDLQLADDDRRDLLETIHVEASRLSRMVANLLDLSRIEAGAATPHRELWPVDELVGRALEELQNDRIEVRLPSELPPVEVDASQIQRVLVNLVENALKFSPPGAPVLITGETDGTEVVLRVLDEGPGVPEAELESVFDPFSRGSAAGPGSGLGLAIARGFAKANGARVWAEPRGEFVLAVPAAARVPAP